MTQGVRRYMLLDARIWFSTKTTLVLSPIAETKSGGAVCADAAVAAAITPKPNKGKNRCFINLPLGMLLSFLVVVRLDTAGSWT
jgi:hypothetical protein